MSQDTLEQRRLLPLEIAALRWLLKGDIPVLIELNRQVDSAFVKRRELSSVGSYTYLGLPRGRYGRVVPPDLKLTSVDMLCDECPLGGIGFVLYLNNGHIDLLEAFTSADEMPSLAEVNLDRCKFVYTNNRAGDLGRLENASLQNI